MHKDLKDFFIAINDWIEAGCPEENDYDFSRDAGLCWNYRVFLGVRENLSLTSLKILTKRLEQEFKGMLYPFNENSADYTEECCLLTIFSNPKRLKFIKDQIHIIYFGEVK